VCGGGGGFAGGAHVLNIHRGFCVDPRAFYTRSKLRKKFTAGCRYSHYLTTLIYFRSYEASNKREDTQVRIWKEAYMKVLSQDSLSVKSANSAKRQAMQ
jgi:hypothetical protein